MSEFKSPTRRDYMNNRCTFAEFYRAIYQEAGISYAHSHLLPRVIEALAKGDEHLNTIPLSMWDRQAAMTAVRVATVLEEHGDFYSLAGGVCVHKQAAKDAAHAAFVERNK